MSVWVVLFGFAMLSVGLCVRFGRLKRSYVIRVGAMWGEVVRHGPIPLGICFIATGIVMSDLIPKEAKRIGFLIVVMMFVVSLALSAWRPRWLKPRWLLWLEDNYPDQMEALLEDARRDSWAWQERVRTQQGLEEWARQTVAKCERR